MLADLAVQSLHAEADLTPKPGLVDRRGPGAHSDMTREMLHASAESLRSAFEQCARATAEHACDIELRRALGRIGRAGEVAMLRATNGVNTHRGALWALGLLCAGAAKRSDIEGTVMRAAELARIPDPENSSALATNSHGAHVRRRFQVGGAVGEAQAGFPHIIEIALPALLDARNRKSDEPTARLHSLLALMAHLDDTCILHRGGMTGLVSVQAAAQAVLDAGGPQTISGRRQFTVLDHLCVDSGWSPGGSGDLLAATLFLVTMQEEVIRCRH